MREVLFSLSFSAKLPFVFSFNHDLVLEGALNYSFVLLFFLLLLLPLS
jgi:hypothetical protein